MCVTLEKGEIVSEVGESLFIFKDCLKRQGKKMFFIWCIFSLVNVSVFLPP